MSKNDFDFDALFEEETAVEAGTEQEVDIYKQQEETLQKFKDEYAEAETGLNENPIYQILASEKTVSEQEQAIIDAVVTEIGEDSEAVIALLKELNAKYAELTTVTSESVRASSNLDQASVFTETMQEMADNQTAYSEKADMFFHAIAALQAAQTENKGIKDIIAEAKEKRKKHQELQDAMLVQAEEVSKAQGKLDEIKAKRDRLQGEVDEAQATFDKYTEGCEEVKDEQTGEVIQEKIHPIASIKAAAAAEKDGWFGRKSEKKKKLEAMVEANETLINDANEVIDNKNPQIANLNPQVKDAKEALAEAQAEFEAQQAEFKAIEEALANDKTIQAVEQVIGNTSTHFAEQAKVFQDSGTNLITLMKDDFAKCVEFYAQQQDNVSQLINVSGNLQRDLALIITALRKAETIHEKKLEAMSAELEEKVTARQAEEEAEIEAAKAEFAEDQDALDKKLAEIEKAYIDLPVELQQLTDDVKAYQEFLRSYEGRLDQIVSFDQKNTVALETSNITLNNAKDLARQAESLKNEQIATVSTSTTNATNTVEQLLMETKMHVIEEFGAAAEKKNVVLTGLGVDTMVHRKKERNKTRKGNIENLVTVRKTIDSASENLKKEAVKSVALSQFEAKAVKDLQDSAQELANTTKTSEAEINERMQSDEEFKGKVMQTGAAFIKGGPKQG